ncbi:MAG: methyltransferase domain-containing protein, partial [Nitrospiraceae bacterium]|nr:methyltransferase domain-containing protein [Nitrospiraceae bacterium]
MQAYEQCAPTYDEKILPVPDSDGLEAVEEIVVLSLLRNIKFNDVLDAATGTGRWAVRLAQMGKRVVGIDSSPQMLAQARAKASELQLDIEFRPASVLAVPQADETFDLVICALALAHVKDLADAVLELVRVLRCGGHLIITDLHPNIQKLWGPNYSAFVYKGRLLIDGGEKDRVKAQDPKFTALEVPFPNYHGEISEYLDSLEAAGAELLAAIDVPMQQGMGLLPGPLVIFARKSDRGKVKPFTSADARNS